MDEAEDLQSVAEEIEKGEEGERRDEEGGW